MRRMARVDGGNKYHARRCTVDGHSFDSQAEAARWIELRLLETVGEITELHVHPRYLLIPAFTDGQGVRQRAMYYEPDFDYYDNQTKTYAAEEVKGGRATMTAAWRLKAKLFRYTFPAVELRVVER